MNRNDPDTQVTWSEVKQLNRRKSALQDQLRKASDPETHLGLEHIGLAVTNIDAVCADLKARGAEFTVEPHSPRPGLRMAFVRAPENVRIEVLQSVLSPAH